MSDFFRFAEAHGVLIKSLIPSGKIIRCATVLHPRSTNGAYMWDGQRGFVFAWDGAAEPQWFNDPSAKPWSDAEKREFAAKREGERREQLRRQERAAQHAQELLQSAVLAEHNYFHFKGIPLARGFVLPDGALLVPMRALSGALQGAQIIRWDHDNQRYDKRMLPGMKAKGAVLRIGPPRAPQTFLCEGYVTGLSIEMAVRQMRLSAAVLVCFSDSNLAHVAPSVTGAKYVFADNDASGAGERAAKATGLQYCMSDVLGNDANDDHAQLGLMAVCQKLMNVRRQVVMETS
jgi:putative DNA primase/helicase